MRILALAVGVLIAAIGIVGMAAPELLTRFMNLAMTPGGLYATGALRFAFGIVLIAAAAVARMPMTLRIIGIVFLIAGVITPLIGVERARAMADWWLGEGWATLRLWSVLAVAIGLFIVYAVGRRPGRS